MTSSGGDLHTPVFPDITGQDIHQTIGLGLPAMDQSGACTLPSADHPMAFSPMYFSPNLQSLANSPVVTVPNWGSYVGGTLEPHKLQQYY